MFKLGRHVTRFPALQVLLAALLVSLVCSTSGFADFRVTPIKLFFDQGTRSGTISVFNTGEEPLRVRVEAMEWTQDQEGKDVYEETGDITYFPKMLTVEPGGKRIIRAGIRQRPEGREKTYRIFIRELPPPATGEQGRVNITIAIRFGVPVFVAPTAAEARGEIGGLELSGGTVSLQVANSGSVHFFITRITVSGRDGEGAETFSRQMDGWYLLSGAARSYEADITGEECRASERITVEALTDRLVLTKDVHVTKDLCGP
jgi:fimbrial chaperone protein